MINLITITKSWYQFASGDEATKELMKERLAVCEDCEYKKMLNSFGQAIIKAIDEEGSMYLCGLCGCPLAGKTSLRGNECPIKKWLAV